MTPIYYPFLINNIDNTYRCLQDDIGFIEFPEMHEQILENLQAVVRAAKPTEHDREDIENYDKVALFNTLMQKPLYCVQLMEKLAQEYPDSVFSIGKDMKTDIMEVKKLALEAALEIAGALSTSKQKFGKPPVTPEMTDHFFGQRAGVSTHSTAAKLAPFLSNYLNLETLKQARRTQEISMPFAEALRQTETLAQSKDAALKR